MVVVPGAEVTQNHIRAKHNSHIVALGLKQFISADLKAKEILEEIRRQGGAEHRVPPASSHDHAGWRSPRATSGITGRSWPSWSTCGRRPTATICFR